MKITMRGGRSSIWICTLSFLYSLLLRFIDGACVTSVTELWAYGNPSKEHFSDSYTKYLTSDKGETCRWIISASDKDEVVKVSFPVFQLKNSTSTERGDCVNIYDGKTTKAPQLARLCDKTPQEYTSSDREMLVVYRRGKVEGDRKFSMTYMAKSVLSQEKIMRIAGIVIGVLAAVGLTFVLFRATKCCDCLRNRSSTRNRTSTSQTSPRERDRLTTNGDDTEANGVNVRNGSSSPNPVVTVITPSGATANPLSASQLEAASTDAAHESDTDSLRDMNEPPPSYESLYLNEEGEPITPPKYSPPLHRSTHAPRRANTFN